MKYPSRFKAFSKISTIPLEEDKDVLRNILFRFYSDKHFFFFKARWRLLVSHLGTQFMNKKMTTPPNFKDIFLLNG